MAWLRSPSARGAQRPALKIIVAWTDPRMTFPTTARSRSSPLLVWHVRLAASSRLSQLVLPVATGWSWSEVFCSVIEPAVARPSRSLNDGRDRRVERDDGRSAGSAGEGLELVLHDQGVEDLEHRGLVVRVEGGEVGELVAQDVLG